MNLYLGWIVFGSVSLVFLFIFYGWKKNQQNSSLLFSELIKLQNILSVMQSKIESNDKNLEQKFYQTTQENRDLQTFIERQMTDLKQKTQIEWQQYRQNFDTHQLNTLKLLQDSLQNGLTIQNEQVHRLLQSNMEILAKQFDKLTEETNRRLENIGQKVDQRLAEGFEKTSSTFTDIIKRLALIDVAQQKITELSTNVVSLQEILSDKRARGAFGEIQLQTLIGNMLPPQHFALQYTLSNNKRVDCILFLPAPSGHFCIDAKFPLENYHNAIDTNQDESIRKIGQQQFRQNIRKHIQDVSEKYIISGETADGAMMFIPAESVFAEIHAHYPDLIEYAHQKHVFLVSPTTMMAILTTARAVLKDEATRKQVHEIRDHLMLLAKDFGRFQQRMQQLAGHIDQAHKDVKEVHISAEKITQQFMKIEQGELSSEKLPA